jgi:hypothetical protein
MYPDRDYVDNKVFWLALRLRISDALARRIYQRGGRARFSQSRQEVNATLDA